MRIDDLRRTLLAAASVLVLSAGVTLAQESDSGSDGSQGSDSGGTDGGDSSGGDSSGSDSSGGDGSGGSGSDGGDSSGDDGGGDSGGGDDGGAGSGGDDGSGTGGTDDSGGGTTDPGGGTTDPGGGTTDPGGGTTDPGGGTTDPGGGTTDPGGGITDPGGGTTDPGGGTTDPGGGAVGGPPSVDDGSAPPSPTEPATASVPERDSTFSAEDLVEPALPPLDEWSLTEFYGKRVLDPFGTGLGTVEGVVVDAANNLYLVTALDSEDIDGQERVIPLAEFARDPDGETLVLNQEAVGMLPQMAVIAQVASAFMMVDSDEKLRSLLAAPAPESAVQPQGAVQWRSPDGN